MAHILVLFASLFGSNAQLAELTSDALSASGAEVRVRRVPEIAFPRLVKAEVSEYQVATTSDLEWADGFVFSSPAHTGMMSASMKAFIDQHHDEAVAGRFLNRTFAAMSTSAYAHAGQEQVISNLTAIAAAWGCLIVPPSTADATFNRINGNPYGVSFVLDNGALPQPEIVSEALHSFFARFVSVTEAVSLSGVLSRESNNSVEQAAPVTITERFSTLDASFRKEHRDD